ncbi:protein neprosin-like [Quercus suber]|uniref:protein neprosin-like n=1 Tax=Quercus suber TaxID=58331 RepID=UPI0032E014A1
MSFGVGEIYGARASLNVWNPVVDDGEFSLAQIWVLAGPDEELNTIEAGWKENGKWWFQVQDQVLGYWPGTIFNYLVSSASRIEWGGEVYNAELGDHHTRTQMGSGHFGNEGYGKASYFRNIGYMDNSGKFIDVEARSLKKYATRPSCYNVEVANNINGGFETHFYFGGPGYSTQCAN